MSGAAARAAAVQAELEARGAAWPGPIVALDTVASTNEWLKETARHGAREWTTVLAERQTAGRGRGGHAWISPPGNLYVSVLLRPRLPPARLTLLPLAAGVAVAEALVEWGVAAALKWPNDVLVGERKVAGILAEAVSSAGGADVVVVGIGVNVALERAELPEGVRASVTSIREETGRAPAVAAVAGAVLARLAVWYDAAVARGAAAVLPAWRALSLPWWGHDVEVRCGDQVTGGVARGIDDTGALVLETRDGGTRTVLAGEARLLRRR